MVLTSFSLLMPAFALLHAPTILSDHLLRMQNAPLPYPSYEGIPSFGGVFSPVTLSAQLRLTSELLRTL